MGSLAYSVLPCQRQSYGRSSYSALKCEDLIATNAFHLNRIISHCTYLGSYPSFLAAYRIQATVNEPLAGRLSLQLKLDGPVVVENLISCGTKQQLSKRLKLRLDVCSTAYVLYYCCSTHCLTLREWPTAYLFHRHWLRLRHRGPDWSGYEIIRVSEKRTHAIGHERLGIINPDSGAQPLVSPNGQVRSKHFLPCLYVCIRWRLVIL